MYLFDMNLCILYGNTISHTPWAPGPDMPTVYGGHIYSWMGEKKQRIKPRTSLEKPLMEHILRYMSDWWLSHPLSSLWIGYPLLEILQQIHAYRHTYIHTHEECSQQLYS